MKLQIGSNLGNNKIRLDFRQSPGKPDNAPNYQIDVQKADEFVKKYNKQSKTLLNFTVLTSAAGALAGFFAAIKAKSPIKVMLSIFIGTLAGLCAGTAFSASKKNSLMKQYNIKEI